MRYQLEQYQVRDWDHQPQGLADTLEFARHRCSSLRRRASLGFPSLGYF